jgi:heme exporter protein C
MSFYRYLQLASQALLVLTAGLVFYALYFIFLVVPNEKVMGPVQRIFYFHVGSAIACYCACGLVLVGALGYLATRSRKVDALLEAAGEVGFVFCTIVLASGMIWGHSAWNTWFRWEPRLVSFLVLWFIFLSFNLVRFFGDRERVAAHSAVLGIVGALMVPVVVFSIKFLPNVPQLHPVIVENRGLKDPRFVAGMFIAMGALVLLQALLILIRTRIGLLERGEKDGN